MMNKFSTSTDTLELINRTDLSIVCETSMDSESLSSLNILNFNNASPEKLRIVQNNTPERVNYINELEILPLKTDPKKCKTSRKICTILIVFIIMFLLACFVISLC